MAQHLRVADHLSSEELKERYLAANDPVERTHFQVLHLASLQWRSADIAEATGYSVIWVRSLVRRFNERGPDALGDQRHFNPGQRRLLSSKQEAELEQCLREPPADGGPWSGPKVTQWIREQIGRDVADTRGWEMLRRLGWGPRRPRRWHTETDSEDQPRFPGSAPGATSN